MKTGKKSNGKKQSKGAKEKQRRELRAKERKLAREEKHEEDSAGNTDINFKQKDPVKTLRLSPSAGSRVAMNNLNSGASTSTSKGIDISSVPTNPKDRMNYLKAKYPGLQAR